MILLVSQSSRHVCVKNKEKEKFSVRYNLYLIYVYDDGLRFVHTALGIRDRVIVI